MPGLCPNCGRVLCDCTLEERGQTLQQFDEDQRRELTPKEETAWKVSNTAAQIAAAREITEQRRQGTFQPVFPH